MPRAWATWIWTKRHNRRAWPHSSPSQIVIMLLRSHPALRTLDSVISASIVCRRATYDTKQWCNCNEQKNDFEFR
jgi:hypothetical protein